MTNRVEIALLPRCARRDVRTAPRRHDDVVLEAGVLTRRSHRRRRCIAAVALREYVVDVLLGERAPRAGDVDDLAEEAGQPFDLIVATAQDDVVAAHDDGAREGPVNHGQMAVARAE